jgi:hypothetical protein
MSETEVDQVGNVAGEPAECEGGQWVPSHLLSETLIALAQSKCDGLDWWVNNDGKGWAWFPDNESGTRDCFERMCFRTIVPDPASFDFVGNGCGQGECHHCGAATLYDPTPSGF